MADIPQLPVQAKPGFFKRTVGNAFLKTTRTAISTIKPSDWMSALQPLVPFLPYVFGRQWDFQIGRNINYTPRSGEKISFQNLRCFARDSEIVRLAIETRKDQLCSQPWHIRPKEDSDVDEDDPRIAELTAFFKKPDRYNKWPSWYRMILEELFVTDAVTLWRQKNRGGSLYALRPIDGSTIFPLIDDHGYRPTAPDPAYQQILKGVPKGNYTTEELIYAPRNVRVYSVYGFGPVEQVITSCKTDIERQKYQLSYFTEGSMPDGYVTMPEGIPSDQIKSFEERTNALLAGNAVGRRQMPFWPFGTKVETLKQPNQLKDDFDEWLARKICFALSIPPTPFIKAMNRANSEAQHTQAIEEGQGPVMDWTADFINEIIVEDFGFDDLEFAFMDDKELDQQVQSTILVNEVSNGIITINEARAEKGLEPSEEPAADELLLKSASGWIPLPGSQLQQDMDQQKLDSAMQINASKPAPAPPGAGTKKPAKKMASGKAVRHEPVPFPARQDDEARQSPAGRSRAYTDQSRH